MHYRNGPSDSLAWGDLIGIVKTGDYNSLRTLKGILAVLGPLFPIVVVVEPLVALLYRKFKIISYKISFFSYVLNDTIGKFISIAAVSYCIGIFYPHAIFKSDLHGIGLSMDILFGNSATSSTIFLHTKFDCSGVCIAHTMHRNI